MYVFRFGVICPESLSRTEFWKKYIELRTTRLRKKGVDFKNLISDTESKK